QIGVDRTHRRSDVEGDPVFLRDHRLRIRPDLVRRVSVHGDPVRANQDEIDLAVTEEVARGAVRDDRVLDTGFQELPRGQPRSLEAGSGLVYVDEEASPVLLGDAHRSRRGSVVYRGQGSGVTVREDSRSVTNQLRSMLPNLSALLDIDRKSTRLNSSHDQISY